MDLDDLMYDRGGYATMRAYRRSKLANLLFTYELHRRVTRTEHGHPPTRSTLQIT